jgi:hypothetical protein
MAVREVIRFRFSTQAVRDVHSPLVLKPSFLFEHSPPTA